MNQFVVDRIQTGGVNSLNIPQEKIRELGNFQAVGVVRDTPELSFSLECLDVDTEVEALLTGSDDPSGDLRGTDGASGSVYDLAQNTAVDVVSPFKSREGSFDIVRGVAVPHLQLESASYRYGLKENAGETFSLRGDSIYYIPGTPYVTTHTGNGVLTTFGFTDGAATPVALTALLYNEQGQSIYALNVSVNGVRQTKGVHYNDSATGVTFTTPPPAGSTVRLVFGSATAATYGQNVHQGVSVKPAAIRGKDIQVYVGGTLANPFRWSDVQSVSVEWRSSLEDDFEFGNVHAVSREATDVPTVSGTIEIKPLDADALFAKLRQISGVSNGAHVIGPNSSVVLPIEIRLMNPDSGGTTAVAAGTVLKTLYIPDARITLPGYEGRVGQKVTTSLSFESDSGVLRVFRGRRFE